MVFALCVVALWSWQDGASTGTIVLRLVAATFIVQFGYFIGVYMMARREAQERRADPTAETATRVSPHAPETRHPSLDM